MIPYPLIKSEICSSFIEINWQELKPENTFFNIYERKTARFEIQKITNIT